MTTTFNVSLVFEGLKLTDQNLDRLFEIFPDAVPASIGGVITVTTPVEAGGAEQAAFTLADAVVTSFPGVSPLRVDQDLVSIPDIAERTGRTRESIRLLVEAKRGPGSFPAPVGIVGDGIRIWSWATVIDWFANVLGEDLGERGVAPEVAAVVDACLAARRRHLTHRAKVAWSGQQHGEVKVKQLSGHSHLLSLVS